MHTVIHYIDHVKKAVENSQNEISQLTPEILKLPGMSQRKNRHLMNNLGGVLECSYLEVGLYKGSTFASTCFANQGIVQAIGIDNWSEFTDMAHILEGNMNPELSVKQQFVNVFDKYCSNNGIAKWYDHNAWSFDKAQIIQPINLFLYDGEHSFNSQRMAYHYFNDVLADVFVTVVDDWECTSNGPRGGTLQAFEDLNYKIRYYKELPSGIPDGYHGGICVAVVEK